MIVLVYVWGWMLGLGCLLTQSNPPTTHINPFTPTNHLHQNQVTGMQSGLGLLTYQGQTGAVGHGEYFFFHFGACFLVCTLCIYVGG